ncbi:MULTISPECIES: aminotransferase class V-fold PLP-dependent enzyme [unclassified Oceanispirochaeta]|uniref:aminotransferase class V-fold PLP-dependent enzyme n=1 Tax=unclassified Oceanispirochaeta TaxID=2635722 RepID=UPI000E08D1EC|nr:MULTISPECIES: aminotransferase class V-fold PLP-dependent enzyme [unclassified Oceanispirochaeta]MBF9018460.1 aminotransferase class V-fold PLP-dependent enzyme [Oceanispirochaeta sp. M2]NPD73912.1 aminotransferase class V-fold PLP-dependent enzyme [Oceanispirochaeta sp. M1]RDG30370.1 aminotransferase class V-fold PLP-dependent enzyme [Oceanispirochaeta sp. M1]
MTLTEHFLPFRENIIGIDQTMELATSETAPIVYADWVASGRLYGPIEKFMSEKIGPMVANTHTETTVTGTTMTRAYHDARKKIKEHVGADKRDSLFLSGFGMTAAISKLQRLLGLRLPEGCPETCHGPVKPLVIITHMEHHSNQISWEECACDVEILPRVDKTGLPDLKSLAFLLKKNSDRPLLIGAFSGCSNVTGIITPYYEMAKMMHQAGGYCFIDFAASAPYVDINMHPEDPEERLDAIYFSPHKFLGGPGSSGVLVLSNDLYQRVIPDQPGGGTVKWTTPFGSHSYFDEIEIREDGGTPGFLQAIRCALAIEVKEAMEPSKIRGREEELYEILYAELKQEPLVYMLEPQNKDRLGIVSIYAPGEHHNLIVKLLNDRFGVQTRGGCSCAGTYGHILFSIDHNTSMKITDMIDSGNLTDKPGWVRISLHPTMTDDEARYVGSAVVQVIRNYKTWREDYDFHQDSGEFTRKLGELSVPDLMSQFIPV